MRTLAADFEPELGGLNHYPEYSNWESWRMYMKDLGVRCDRLGRVNLKEFTKYRAIVESKQPLARELNIVRLRLPTPEACLVERHKPDNFGDARGHA